MVNDAIYDYKKFKLRLLRFSQYKIVDEQGRNIKFLNIKKKLEGYKNESNQDKKYIKVFILSEQKVLKQYDQRLDKLNLNFLNNYEKEKSNLSIIIYFFDDISKSKYKDFSMTCESIMLKVNIKSYIINFIKYILPLNGLIGIFLTAFTIYALSEYGIPIAKVTDFPVIALSLIFSIIFLSIILSVFSILVVFLLIPFSLYTYAKCDNMLVLSLSLIIPLTILILYLIKYRAHLPSKIFPASVKFSIFTTTTVIIFIPGIFLFQMAQSIISSITPGYLFYNKSSYHLVMEQYIKRFSGYPKILEKDNKRYYVPIADSKYYYVYDLEKSKDEYIKDLKKTKLTSTCKNKKTKEKFQKNYLINNPYIKPQFLTEKISIKDKKAELKPLVKFGDIISLKEINDLCANLN